jgi:integrase
LSSLTAPKDVAELMERIDTFKGSEIIRGALWFSLYTFQRPGEIRGATWEEMDLTSGLWRIPERRMKNRRARVVPLSRQVVVILESLKRIAGNSLFVFPSIRSAKIPMSGGTVRLTLRAMGYTSEQMCAHGFRALASTNLNEQGWWKPVS